MMKKLPPSLLLPVIVFAQFAGTSLWFAGNAVINEIQQGISAAENTATITSLVQFGFIAGTLLFSLFVIADRFPASKVFFFSSLIAAAANVMLVWWAHDTTALYALRFITGFFLAGIYPVGMKIAADYFPKQIGNALGFLVGALVLGTAFPHLVRWQFHALDWQLVLYVTSALAVAGGALIYLLIPSFTSLQKGSFRFHTAFTIFKIPAFRSAAFGYFGHMWELYTLWAFIPLLLQLYNEKNGTAIPVALWSFIIIAAGSIGCVVGGLLSKKTGSKSVAFYSLLLSGFCCLLAALVFEWPPYLFVIFLLIWGISVVADSPQFSSLVAQAAPPENKGTALTIVTSVGFAITIVSVQFLKYAFAALGTTALLFLVAGPVFGLLYLRQFKRN